MDFTKVTLFISKDDGVIRAIHSTGPSVCSFEDTELDSAEQVDSFMQLFAAAPELLAALIDTVAALESYVPELDSEYQLCSRARAAIAKAEGGQP